MKDQAVVVLGCRIASGAGKPLAGAAGRRASAGAKIARERDAEIVVAAGGRGWHASGEWRVEADALAEELVRSGVDASRIVRERASRTTRENARFVARALAERGVTRVLVVTCAWHVPRAVALFRAEGLEAAAWPVAPPPSSLRARAYRVVRERIAMRLDRLFFAVLLTLMVACSKGGGSPDASVQNAKIDAGADLGAIGAAEDERRADLVTEAMRTSDDVLVRRRAARALARIADAPSQAGLLRALEDEDAETVAWGAYGLGFSCKGREDASVRALAARAASLDVEPETSAKIDPRAAIARALGRCGGSLAESTLASWTRGKGKSIAWREQAALALGDVAGRRGTLDDDTVTALLDAAGDGVATALYPFARAQRLNDAFDARLLEVAKKALAGPKSDDRVFAVRALAKAGEGAIPELSRVAIDTDATWTERIDAMRSLGKLGESGRAAAADALAKIVPNPSDAFAVLSVGGDVYGEIVAGLVALGQTPPPKATAVLSSLASLRAAGEAPLSLARRLATIRCTAASLLAHGAFDASGINACDTPGEAVERARLAALLRRPMVGPRRVAWVALTKSEHLRVREDALGAFGAHGELGETGVAAIAVALADTKHPGVVATAAEVLSTHPERVLVLSAKERRNALDPNAPPPPANPEEEIAPAVAKALTDALAFKFADDAIETRAGLIDAAAALHARGAKAAATAACDDPNQTMRDHAQKALHALGDSKTTCAPPKTMPLAKEVAAPHGGKLVLDTDAGTLTIAFDDELAPVASTRVLDLAKAGFFDGTIVHRVVPGFVVQLGDPQGDGYGGSGEPLRCETSPVPFGLLDVGMALAGRDTGSSQFFVSLGRYPHLDGDYARVGKASGDWFAVAEGDVVKHAHVE
ncbi:MAG TPA: ElyC/SanA/YdcF family protein [Polyangiaceae bacterium]|jgi:cyclophilin family peptidyl-prolyl cis-trans isomerase/uncharacterized SAM-binding protein YcdF (DUF218 family)